jgi:glycerate 2-kinase
MMPCIVTKASITTAAKMTLKFEPSRFSTASLRTHIHGALIMRALSSAFQAVEPGAAVGRFLEKNPLPNRKRIFAFGLGKAATAMTQSLADLYPLTDSLIITKHASSLDLSPVTVILGDHPIPGSSSLRAGDATKKFLSQLTKDDLLVCLISGGGSALMAAPLIPLEDLQSLTSALLSCGARIDEINTLRRHLDLLKGGGVAQHANGAQIISLILSDVVGDSLEAIASGPTAPDLSTRDDALAILQKYELHGKIPTSIIPALRETAKPSNAIFDLVQNHLIGNNMLALETARSQFEADGMHTKIINSNLQGEAREVGREMANRLKAELEHTPRPFCLLAGGETTVTLHGNGRGGRNQELALSTVGELAGIENVLLISIATDGEDGPTDAAGAVVTGETAQRAKMLGLDATDFLLRNDAYSFFAQFDELIKPGPSGTNVNDLVLCFAF